MPSLRWPAFTKTLLDIPIISMGRNYDFSVAVSYTGHDHNLDTAIFRLAKQFRGIDLGSGYGFGHRDLTLGFKTFIEALAFKSALPALRLRVRFGSISYLNQAGLYVQLDPVVKLPPP